MNARKAPHRFSPRVFGMTLVFLAAAAQAGLGQQVSSGAGQGQTAQRPPAIGQTGQPAQAVAPGPGGAQSPSRSPVGTLMNRLKSESPFPKNAPVKIPMAGTGSPDRVSITRSNGRISMVVRNAPLNQVLMHLAQHQGVSIVCADSVTTPVSVTLDKVSFEDALTAIVSIAGSAWVRSNGIIHVTSVTTAGKLSAEVQGRQIRVFRLDFASATDVETAVKGMLSPVGKSFTSVSKPTDNRKTEEVVVVEDLPGYLRIIEQYVEKVDQPPRQVLIEAHVLAVTLQRDKNCGVNFKVLIEQLGKAGGFQLHGFANPLAAQAFFFSVDRGDLDLLVEALATQSDAKTLASPKVLVLNGQEAKIQVGQQLGFRVTTTTETSTLENVNFLEVGVVLKVTPRVCRNGEVLMQVKPEVSKGRVSPLTGLPESDTTQVETNVMLPDGRGMVIGGLIQDKDTDSQQKIPILGDIWLIGKLFQRHEIKKERQEIIITLVPRIVPAPLACDDRHSIEVLHTQTPLFEGPLDRAERPWEPKLPDAIENPGHLRDLPAVQKRIRDRCGFEPAGPAYAEPYYAGERQLCPPHLRATDDELPVRRNGPARYPDREVEAEPGEMAPLPPPRGEER